MELAPRVPPPVPLQVARRGAVPKAAWSAALASCFACGQRVHLSQLRARERREKRDVKSEVKSALSELNEFSEESSGVKSEELSLEAFSSLRLVPKRLWSLLSRVAEAKSADRGLSLGLSLAEASQGVKEWRDRLRRGRSWSDEEGANWPEKALRHRWQQLLREKGLPRLVKQYEKMLDPLMTSLLETVEQYHQEAQDQDQQQNEDEEEDNEEEDEEEDKEDKDDDKDDDKDEDEDEEDDGEDDGDEEKEGKAPPGASPRSQVAEKLMERLGDDLDRMSKAAEATNAAFGSPGQSEGLWQRRIEDWEQLMSLAKVMRASPELRELLRNLGRRSAVRGPLRRLPEELPPGPSAGVTRSPAAPAEATGVTRSGDWDTMLPSEAQLLVGSEVLRTVHHARRIEQSLLCYERSSWLEEPAKRTLKRELRPMGRAGPLIVCLDTSGSMMGERELWSKALVVECVRQAHRQKRLCYLYAFSGPGDLQELELDMSPRGLNEVMDFLQNSFGGGTCLEDALKAAAERLQLESYASADLLVVTDGELVAQRIGAEALEAARQNGTKIFGLVLNEESTELMEELCDELYVTRKMSEKGFPKLMRPKARPKAKA